MQNMRVAVALLGLGALVACGDSPPAPPSGLADTVPPGVVALQPMPGQAGVRVDALVSVTFSEPVNPATVAPGSFFLTAQFQPVPGSYRYGGQTATFVPDSDFAEFTTYTATLTQGVRDSAGNGLVSDTTWSFTTGSAIPPLRGAAACGSPPCPAP
jgi:hypothetical protein